MSTIFKQTLQAAVLSCAVAASFAALSTTASAQYYGGRPQYGDDRPDYPPPPPRYRPRYGEGYGGPRWQRCAFEGQFCRAPAGVVVRFGALGRYIQRRSPPGGLPCANGVFGGDPTPGVQKTCFIQW